MLPELPGNNEVFIATPTKLEIAVFAPPPAPPRQFPLVRQMVPLASGIEMV
jgi:hypothetical protein